MDTILSTVLYIFSSCCLLAAFLSPSAAPPREIHIIRKELEIHMGSFKRAGRSTYMYCTVPIAEKKDLLAYWSQASRWVIYKTNDERATPNTIVITPCHHPSKILQSWHNIQFFSQSSLIVVDIKKTTRIDSYPAVIPTLQDSEDDEYESRSIIDR